MAEFIIDTERMTIRPYKSEIEDFTDDDTANRRTPDWGKGINAILLKALADEKPHRPKSFRASVEAAGYSETSIRVTLRKVLQKHGLVTLRKDGCWVITSKGKSEADKL